MRRPRVLKNMHIAIGVARLTILPGAMGTGRELGPMND